MFPERLEQALSLREKKQKELAEHLDVTDNTISYFCTGKRKPSIIQLSQIAKFLNVTSDYLLGLSDIPNPDAGVAREYYIKATKKEKRLSNLAELLGNVSEEIKEVLNATP